VFVMGNPGYRSERSLSSLSYQRETAARG